MWFVYALLTAIAWGFCYVCIEQVLKGLDKSLYLSISGIVNCVFWIIWFTFYRTYGKLNIEFSSIKWWLAGGIVATVAGNYFSIKAIELKSATHAAVVEISYPLWCVAFTIMLIGHNPLTWKSACGMGLVILGTIIFLLGEK